MLDFFNMSDKDIILLSAVLAVAIADGLTDDELNTLGNFIMCIGQDLVSAAAQKGIVESKETQKKGNGG